MFKVSLSRWDFFRIRLIIASFIDVGIMALVSDVLTIAVSIGVRVMYTSLRTEAGIGSRGHDFRGYCFIILVMSDSETGVKRWSRESLGRSGEMSESRLDDSREIN